MVTRSLGSAAERRRGPCPRTMKQRDGPEEKKPVPPHTGWTILSFVSEESSSAPACRAKVNSGDSIPLQVHVNRCVVHGKCICYRARRDGASRVEPKTALMPPCVPQYLERDHSRRSKLQYAAARIKRLLFLPCEPSSRHEWMREELRGARGS